MTCSIAFKYTRNSPVTYTQAYFKRRMLIHSTYRMSNLNMCNDFLMRRTEQSEHFFRKY